MKMKSTLFPILAALSLCSSAAAVQLNPRGLGQVLIHPYYTANNGQDTLLSVVNASSLGKVMQVRFLEGYNSRVVLDFVLYFSPHDSWTGVVTADAASGGAKLVTHDTSCTTPALPATGAAFSTLAYAGGAPAPFDKPDGGPTTPARTREGSIEWISIGDVKPDTPTATRITHVQTGVSDQGVPPGCGELTLGNILADLQVPLDSAFGSGAIVNGGEGTFYTYNADAIAGFTDKVLLDATMTAPDLRQANSAEATRGVARAYMSTGRSQVAIDFARGEDAVSAVFMASALHNEYVIGADLGAATDWIVSFPTKRYYTDPAFGVTAPRAPFTNYGASPGSVPVALYADFYDREEAYKSTSPYGNEGCGFICTDHVLSAPYAVNAISIVKQGDPSVVFPKSTVLGSSLNISLFPYPYILDASPLADSGWIRLDLGQNGALEDGLSAADGSRLPLVGMPVTGFMVYNIINAQAQPGKLANYGGSFPHRASAACRGAGNTSGWICLGP